MTTNAVQNFFWEVHIKGLPVSKEQGITRFLFLNGCMGTQESLPFEQPSLVYEAKIKRGRRVRLIAYFPSETRDLVESELMRWVSHNSPETRVSWQLGVSADWLSEWKKHFKPFKLSEFFFYPSWEKPKARTPVKKVIRIEPGMAFGTGTHPTTQFAIKLLVELKKKKAMARKTVVDVGAGSGVLSVIAERLGAREVTAIDNDPECWRECRKTFRLNRAKKAKVSRLQVAEIKKTYDVVVANIIDGVLVSLRGDLWRMLKPGGFMIVSGILADGATAFLKSFIGVNKARVVKELTDGEWTAYIISK
jgi:ribosomal protein L11 methyltransferase